jgi:dihydropteroate synthase
VTAAPRVWELGRAALDYGRRPLVMGVVNLTPDSFFPASRVDDAEEAARRAEALVAAGADLLDLGAESSRPGAVSPGGEEERSRLLPALAAVRRRVAVPLTVDTWRAATARAALDAGADGVNDITAGRGDPDLLPLVAAANCGLVLMHMRGTPATMQADPRYDDVVAEVAAHLEERVHAALAAGVAPSRLLVDPGLGFGKGLGHNLSLLARVREATGGRPALIGASRKSFIADITGAPVELRLPGSLAAAAIAFAAGAAAVRVHDVAETVQMLDVLAAVAAAGERR